MQRWRKVIAVDTRFSRTGPMHPAATEENEVKDASDAWPRGDCAAPGSERRV